MIKQRRFYGVSNPKGEERSMINVYKDKSSGTCRYDFSIDNRRHRGALKEARNLEQEIQLLREWRIWARMSLPSQRYLGIEVYACDG